MKRRFASVVGMLALVAALFYWIAWRSQVIRAPGEPPSRRVLEQTRRIQGALEHGRKVYSQLDMKPVREISSIEQLDEMLGSRIAEAMREFVSDDKPGHDSKSLDDIRKDVIGLMYHRWFAPSFDAYDQFMLDVGYSLPNTYTEITDGRKDSLRLSFKMWTGQEFDPTRPPRDSLRAMWEAGPAGPGQVAELEAFAVDPDGVEFGIKPVTLIDYSGVEFDGALSRVGWHGGESGSIPRYWQPAAGFYHHRVNAGQTIQQATVGVILKFTNGQTVPFCFNCWYDVQTRRWYLESVLIANFQENFGGVFF